MSIHKSLKIGRELSRKRNVLSRRERIEKLQEQGKWQEGDSVLGLPKVKVKHIRVGKKTKKESAKPQEAPEQEQAEAPQPPAE